MMESIVFPGHRPWLHEAAGTLLDMSGQLPSFKSIGEQQLAAAVALHRMLLTHGCAYLADEVGMGKTYVALAVVALFRHVQPGFRVLYLAPSQNVLRKWHEREQPAFIRGNFRQPDMRNQGPAGLPLAASIASLRVADWVYSAVTAPTVLDVFLPFSALSFHLTGKGPQWAERIRGLAEVAGVRVNLTGVAKKDTYKERAASIVNQSIPYYDLVVIDEAHLLKNGASSDRARFLARALGATSHGGIRRFGAALLLSGTPFDRDLEQLVRQFELFASPKIRPSPHQCISDLAEQRRAGGDWSEIQAGLKPYMIRRVQKMMVGDDMLSRNQYRVERRSEARITLAGRTDPEALQQRLFTAVVQKRLIEHLDGENEGYFPMAMFSSWEAYSPARKIPPRVTRAGTDDDSLPLDGEVMDIGKDAAVTQDSRAIDGTLMEVVVDSYRKVFHEEPPHPKLESESVRLGNEAFHEGHKQLVFVRRLKSVDDLYLRVNQVYDKWLVDYLVQEGMGMAANALMDARRSAGHDEARPVQVENAKPDEPGMLVPEGETEVDLPAKGDTLFSWFFRGKLNKAGQDFVLAHKLPAPIQLRERLRDPERFESIIGELDWRGFFMAHDPNLPPVSYLDLANQASGLPGVANALGRYRRLQLAWAQLVAKQLTPREAQPFVHLQDHLRELQIHTGKERDTRITPSQAEALLNLPTVGLFLDRNKLGSSVMPLWEKTWSLLVDTRHSAAENACEVALRLSELDLQREVLFALLRLDHPFIDLYLGWLNTSRENPAVTALALVNRVVKVCDEQRDCFGTGSILRNLAESWDHVAKTNFAEFLKGSDRVDRAKWRQSIQQQLSPFAPVEWASGQNTEARSAIARRFRMPGYPMVLIATSVLQEGEDLHVSCSRVTHFGISGSPIGIEQKNGRVDRIGSIAQRGLQAGRTVVDAGIRVSFPHLAESLEWFQIRDLSQGINDYLRSMHKVGTRSAFDDPTLAQVVANRDPIPPLLPYHLDSPFEPELLASDECVSETEVKKCFAEARQFIDHANTLLADVARKVGLKSDPGRSDRYVSGDGKVILALHPAHTTGELTILATRCLGDDELPDWMPGGTLAQGQPDLGAIQKLTADPCCSFGLVQEDNAWQLHVHASCFARVKEGLDRGEVYDLLQRIGVPVDYSPAKVEGNVLFCLLRQTVTACKESEFKWKPGIDLSKQSVLYHGLRIKLSLWKNWVIASRLIEAEPSLTAANILARTLMRNASNSVPNFVYSSRGQLLAKMIQPVGELGVEELICMLKELAAIPTD